MIRIPKFIKSNLKEGDRFNKLTAIKYSHHFKNKNIWEWKCDCGSIIKADIYNVKIGHTKSCNCYMEGSKRRSEDGPFRRLYSLYKRSAVKRSKEFLLDENQFKEITSRNCHYCGIEPFQRQYNKPKKLWYTYNGIDRVDNSKGYLIDNIVPCCGNCNLMKKDMSYSEFINYIKRIYNYLKL